MRDALTAAVASGVPHRWVEELLIQSYLFSGFPRALNAAREWRKIAATPAPISDESDDVASSQKVYGKPVEKLRSDWRLAVAAAAHKGP